VERCGCPDGVCSCVEPVRDSAVDAPPDVTVSHEEASTPEASARDSAQPSEAGQGDAGEGGTPDAGPAASGYVLLNSYSCDGEFLGGGFTANFSETLPPTYRVIETPISQNCVRQDQSDISTGSVDYGFGTITLSKGGTTITTLTPNVVNEYGAWGQSGAPLWTSPTTFHVAATGADADPPFAFDIASIATATLDTPEIPDGGQLSLDRSQDQVFTFHLTEDGGSGGGTVRIEMDSPWTWPSVVCVCPTSSGTCTVPSNNGLERFVAGNGNVTVTQQNTVGATLNGIAVVVETSPAMLTPSGGCVDSIPSFTAVWK
jgi:hypothetical protein